jgi:hypothetical protein
MNSLFNPEPAATASRSQRRQRFALNAAVAAGSGLTMRASSPNLASADSRCSPILPHIPHHRSVATSFATPDGLRCHFKQLRVSADHGKSRGLELAFIVA